MMGFGKRHDRPFPELLAAYADGELDAAARARVEAWLAAHPAAQATLDAQRRLSRRNRKLWRAAAPSNPAEANWARVFGHVQDAIDAPSRPMPAPLPQRRWRMRYLAPLASAAAACVLYFSLSGDGPAPIVMPIVPAASDAFVFATDADVDIISMDDGDATAIVVGRRPLTGAVVLAGVGDVEFKGVQKDSSGMMPKVQMNDAGLAPMIIAPIAGR
jgi:hypothetical protein